MIGVAPPAYDPAAPTTANTLPVGAPATVRAYVAELFRRHRRAFLLLITVNTVAVIASMAGPYLLGGLVERVVRRNAAARTPSGAHRRAVRRSPSSSRPCSYARCGCAGAMLGERMLADLREDFLVRSVGLPPGVLERAGTGDLLSRITTDIDRLANAMREAVPQLAIGVVWVALLLGGLAVTAPPLAPAVLVAVPLLVVGCRWYFRRAPVRPTARRPPGTPPWPPRSPRPWTRDAPSRRTAWASAASGCRTGGSRSGPPGSGTPCGCGRCSSRSSTSPT